MGARFREVSELATEKGLSNDEAIKMLRDRGVAVIDGIYDNVLYEAVFAAPTGRDGFMSPRTGIGAVQSLVNKLGMKLIVHDANRSQTLVFRKGSQNVVARWQYITAATGNVSAFTVRSFLALDAPTHYFFTNFDGPIAWVANRQMLSRTWNRLRERGNSTTDTTERIPPGREGHETGYLQLRLSENSSKYLLQSAKQLGL